MNYEIKDKCHDCKVEIGEIHKAGCDWEECPICKTQFLCCGCFEEQNEKEIEKLRNKWIKKIKRIPYGQERRF